MPPTIWIDVEDVIVHLGRGARPTGIQRLAFETARALVEAAGPQRIRFLRHARRGRGYQQLSFDALATAYATSVADRAGGPRVHRAGSAAALAGEADPAAQAPAAVRRGWRYIGLRLPGDVRVALLDVLLPQWASLRAVPGLWRAVMRATWRNVQRSADATRQAGVAAVMARGDVLLELAAPWNGVGSERSLAACRDHGLRFAALIYDMIPVARPEFAVVSVQRRFRDWARQMLPLCDAPMAISRHTGHDMLNFAVREGFVLRTPVTVVPIGTGFPSDPAASGLAVDLTGILPAGDYVLFVSTIEVRKNHALLFRVWRRLLEDMPPGAVPNLVFAGGIGWLAGDLMQQIRNANFLNGHLVIVESPSDALLAALYRNAAFTVYPSHYEGWGLPVVESLSFGTPCVVAASTSLPEAGGTLARYFSADDVGDACRVIRHLIEHPDDLAAWRAVVRAEFQPVSWQATAAAVLAAVADPVGPASRSGMDGHGNAG